MFGTEGQQFVSYGFPTLFFNIFAKDFLSNKEESYVIDENEEKSTDTLIAALREKLTLEDEIWRTFQKIADCLKTTDVEKRGKFEDLSKYISHLRNKVFTISLFGEVNSGKSTIINCIIGLEVAHTFLAICMALQSFMKMINTKKFQS
ncbi:unnamed protein product [Umbelopsis vinacea]